MKVLDIDMDFFLNKKTSADVPRVSSDFYHPWKRYDVINFLEKRLGLNKNNKIKGRIFKEHQGSFYFWTEQIANNTLRIPFEVVHIDSHMDLGLGYGSWRAIMDDLVNCDIDDRLIYMKENDLKPNEGDYLLYAISLRWISKLVHVPNINDSDRNDYILYIMENCKDGANNIQLCHNTSVSSTLLNDICDDELQLQKYYENCIFEPKVKFNIVDSNNDYLYSSYDFITFAISPNYTPKEADFIIDIIKEYIDEI